MSQGISKGRLFVITAASGTGKTSLVKALLASKPDLSVCISHTTRAPRVGEVDGVDYHFVSCKDFIALLEANGFLESALVFGNHYGTSQKACDDLLQTGQDVILEIDWQGALQVKKMRADAVLIFILPPSKDALKSRLIGRMTDSPEVIQTRLQGACQEMQQYALFDYLVVNDDFDTALGDLSAIIRCHRLECLNQSTRHSQMIADLLEAPKPKDTPCKTPPAIS